MNYEFYENMNPMSDFSPFTKLSKDNIESLPANNVDYNGKIDLFNPYEGYLKGNSFKNEYIPYKDYRVMKLNMNNEKEELMINIGECSFIMHDLNLYLDVHPNDLKAIEKFTKFRDKLNELITKYERKYGPLSVKGIINKDKTPFEWVNKAWPWVN